jgi:hypothetical protein
MSLNKNFSSMTRTALLAVALIVATFFEPVMALENVNAAVGNSGQALEGTWIASISVLGPPGGFPVPFTALETYSQGGGLVTTNNNPLVLRSGQGAWQKVGNTYTATIVFFIIEGVRTPVGTITVTHRIQVNGDTYVGEGEADFRNNDGLPFFDFHPEPFTFTSTATRLVP